MCTFLSKLVAFSALFLLLLFSSKEATAIEADCFIQPTNAVSFPCPGDATNGLKVQGSGGGPVGSTTTDASSTITTGGTYKTIAAAAPTRQSFEFGNICNVASACVAISDVCYLFIGSGTPNSTTNVIIVPPGATYLRSTGSIPTDALQATCDGTGDHYRLATQ